jgi:uncharacterized membrane protein
MSIPTPAAASAAPRPTGARSSATNPRPRPRWRRALGWLLVSVSGLFALFALVAAGQTAAALVGLVEPEPPRAAPPLFVVHAVTGAVALFTAAVQLGLLATPPPPRQRRWHRGLGLTYVITAVATSVLSLPVVAAFDVGPWARAAFLGEAVLWLATTIIAYAYIRARRIDRHRDWMLRSFAFAAFFITFGLWDPVLALVARPETGPIRPETGFAVAVLLGWLMNLVVAELWIRRSRRA